MHGRILPDRMLSNLLVVELLVFSICKEIACTGTSFLGGSVLASHSSPKYMNIGALRGGIPLRISAPDAAEGGGGV